MLSDRERDVLREIEHRLTIEDPAFVRSFHPVGHRPPGAHRRRAHPRELVVAATMLALLLFGPNPLTGTQAANRTRPPAPRRSSAPPGEPRPPTPRVPVMPGPADLSGIAGNATPSPSTPDTRVTA